MLRVVGDADRAARRSTTPRSARRWDGWRREQAVEMSGSRFAYLMREAVLLELALRAVGHAHARRARGSRRWCRPCSCARRRWSRRGSSPPTARRCTRSTSDELFLVGTSEVPLSAIHRGEILPADGLPRRYLGISSCFRREAGTYGKDTRGIFRVHQFDKVEMFSYCDPATSWDEHEALLAIEESIVGGLGLPYRVVNIAAGDLGAAAAKKYDVEVWLPSEGRVPRAHVVLELPRLLRPPARHTVRATTAATSSCTRSTAPRARSAARWCSSSSTTRTPTAASPCPRCCAPSPASTGRAPQLLIHCRSTCASESQGAVNRRRP